jgi:hypothetical protein
MRFKIAFYCMASAAAAAIPASVVTWGVTATVSDQTGPVASRIAALVGIQPPTLRRIDDALLRGGETALADRVKFLTLKSERLEAEAQESRTLLGAGQEEQIRNQHEVYRLRARMAEAEGDRGQLATCQTALSAEAAAGEKLRQSRAVLDRNLETLVAHLRERGQAVPPLDLDPSLVPPPPRPKPARLDTGATAALPPVIDLPAIRAGQ